MPQRQLEHRIATQAVGVIAIDIAAGGLVDALTQQSADAVADVRWVAAIMNLAGQAGNQPGLLLDTGLQKGCRNRLRGHRLQNRRER